MLLVNWRKVADHLNQALRTKPALLVVPGDGFPRVSVASLDKVSDKLERYMTDVYMIPWVSNGKIVFIVLSYNLVAAWNLLTESMIAIARNDDPEGYKERLLPLLLSLRLQIEAEEEIVLPLPVLP